MPKFLALGICLFLALPTWALEQKYFFDWYNYGIHHDIKSSPLDPSNRIIRSPRSEFKSDLRLDYSASTDDNYQFIFRPKLEVANLQIPKSNPPEVASVTQVQGQILEGYVRQNATDNFEYALGIQNYQWGPAELMGPSNPIYHFQPNQRLFSHRDVGRFLLRGHWRLGDNWNTSLLWEPIGNGEAEWIYDRKFLQKGLLKLEYRPRGSFTYGGLTAGATEFARPFVGSYANWEVTEGFSTYFDARYSSGRGQYVPVTRSSGWTDMEFREDQAPAYLSILGTRFEDVVDARAEFIYNSAGFNREELRRASLSFFHLNPGAEENFRRFSKSGLELPGQRYLYFSLRKQNFIWQDFNASAFYLRSLGDDSGLTQINFDVAVGDFTVLFANGTYNIGEVDQELAFFERSSFLLGAKFTY